MAGHEISLREHFQRLSEAVDRNHANIMGRLAVIEDSINALVSAFAAEPQKRNGEDNGQRQEPHRGH